MSHGKYFSANYTLLGVALLIVISFIYFLVFEKDSEYLRLMTEYYLAPIFYIIFSLLYGLTYNIINQDGLKRTSFFVTTDDVIIALPFTIRSSKYGSLILRTLRFFSLMP